MYTPPKDKEIIEAVIQATCTAFEIEEALLLADRTTIVVNIKHMALYVLVGVANIKPYAICDRFGMKRSSIEYAVEKMSIHKKIYLQTLSNINAIIQVANTFEKKHDWHLNPLG